MNKHSDHLSAKKVKFMDFQPIKKKKESELSLMNDENLKK